MITLKIEVFPAPLRPMMPHRSRSATVKVMFLKSSSAPNEMPTLETESRVTRQWKEVQIGCGAGGKGNRVAERDPSAKVRHLSTVALS